MLFKANVEKDWTPDLNFLTLFWKGVPMKHFILLLIVSFLYAPSRIAQNNPQEESINLNGVWKDNGRPVEIKQSGAGVEAKFINPPLCDPRDNSQPRPREVDFTGTLEGNKIEGKATVCNWGKRWGSQIGIQQVDVTLEVSPDQKTLSGTYQGWKGPVNMTLTRCPESSYEPTREEITQIILEGLRARGINPPMGQSSSGQPMPGIIVHHRGDDDPAVMKYEFIAPLTDRPVEGTSRLGFTGQITFKPCDEKKEIKIGAVFVHDAKAGPRGEDALRGWKGEGYEYSPRGLRRAINEAMDGVQVQKVPRPPT
jgi:hypothetical protein